MRIEPHTQSFRHPLATSQCNASPSSATPLNNKPKRGCLAARTAEGTGRGSTELLLTRALPHPTCAHAKPLCGLMMPISGVMLPAEGSSHQARGSTSFAHSTQKHGDDETNNTTAHPRHSTVETNDTSAPEKCTKNAHFSPAKATTVSIPNRYQRAKAMAVSNHRATSPAAPRRGARGQRQHLRQPNFARNLSWSFFEMPEKRCNSNNANSMFQ